MKTCFTFSKFLIAVVIFIATAAIDAKAQSPDSKGKEAELVVGVPGISPSSVGDVKTALGQNASVKAVVFCPKHEVFLIYLNEPLKNSGDDKHGLNPNTFINLVKNTSGKDVFTKNISATEFYDDCSQYLKNN